jgi:hypothetical protein
MRGALSPARHNVSVGALAWPRSAAPWSRARDEEIAVRVLDTASSRIGVELGCALDKPMSSRAKKLVTEARTFGTAKQFFGGFRQFCFRVMDIFNRAQIAGTQNRTTEEASLRSGRWNQWFETRFKDLCDGRHQMVLFPKS